jgi:hypothetical protein
MGTPNVYSNWLVQYVKDNQEGNFTAPNITTPEENVRAAMMDHFGISNDWAYEQIRAIVRQNPHLHLEKVSIEFGDGTKHLLWQLVWLE